MMEKSISHLRSPVNVSRNVWYAMIKQEITITIQSLRLSKACAALTRMQQFIILPECFMQGEDIKFIARRIMICAAEDVSNADPMALVVATSAAQAVERIGMAGGTDYFVTGGHVCGECAKEQLGSQCNL